MIEFLLRATLESGLSPTRELATKFIARNGFDRPANYNIPTGEKKKDKGYRVSPNTISAKWDDAPMTLGFAYLMRTQQFDRLNSVRVASKTFLSDLTSLASDRTYLFHFFAQYQWLRDFLKKRAPQIEKFVSWYAPRNFSDREAMEIPRFSPDHTNLLKQLSKPSA